MHYANKVITSLSIKSTHLYCYIKTIWKKTQTTKEQAAVETLNVPVTESGRHLDPAVQFVSNKRQTPLLRVSKYSALRHWYNDDLILQSLETIGKIRFLTKTWDLILATIVSINHISCNLAELELSWAQSYMIYRFWCKILHQKDTHLKLWSLHKIE